MSRKSIISKNSIMLFFIFSFFILFSMSLVAAATNRYVATTGSDVGDCSTTSCQTIQYAIGKSIAGDTVNVAAGTYDEQVVIGKSLTLQGVGDTTIIKPSSAAKLTSLYTLGTQTGALWNGKKLASIISVSNTYNVIIKDLKVDGESLTSLPAGLTINDYVVGILYGETGGIVSNVKVINMNKIPEAVRTYGMWLDAVSTTASVEVKNSNVELYNKNGINSRGAKLTINIHDNSVTGPEPDPTPTQYPNGIGIVSGATGTIAKNTVTNIKTPLTDYTATGIFTYDTSGVTIEDNTITEALTGIALSGTPSTGGTSSSTVQRNTVFDCDVGIQLESPNTANNIINYNTINNNEEAIYLSGVDPVYGDYSIGVGNEAHYNKIYSNLQGIENNNPDVIFNAENNWWGSSSGPKDLDGTTEVPPCTDYPNTEKNADGLGDSVSDNVDYCPWLQLNLEVISPESKAYNNTRDILVHVLTDNLLVDKIQYSDNGPPSRTLCTDCNGYNREKTFSEGAHSLTLTATIGSETDSETINFFVDTREPRIIKTLPEDGAIVKGTIFYIKYTETNLEKVILHWKESTAGAYNPQELLGCSAGTNKECTKDIDLDAYDGKKIDYYFELQDPANTVTSPVKTITIDNTLPSVNIISPTDQFYAEKRILVNVEVTNEKVAKLEYFLDGSTRSQSLCTNCDSYNREKTFADGDHTLLVRATDYAGNVGEDTVEFSVDSKAPAVIKLFPRNNQYTNGTFSIVYSEDKLQSITLFYKGVLEPTYHSLPPKTDCNSGKYQQCNFFVDLTGYNNQHIFYYFVITNHISSTTSRTYTETVDTTVPKITINSPLPQTYDSRRVLLDIDVINEQVKLEYSDNGGRFIRLCSRCDGYDNTRTFSFGLHELLIIATDRAGNYASSPVVFNVI